MSNDIIISRDLNVGKGFVDSEHLKSGEDEYRIRNEQFLATGKDPSHYRRLEPFELETLVRQNNSCNDWSLFYVSDPFVPELISNSIFAGLVRIGKMERVSLEHHDLHVFVGIANSQIIACDIGDNCAINNCTYVAHYIIGDNCILIDNAEIHVSNHAKFGNGFVAEGEPEDVRINIDVMNEAGGRWIYPFNGMNCGDAYLWARFRDREELIHQFCRMTDALFDPRRGRYGMIGANSIVKSNGIIKDVMIGQSAYIKGANKLKNLTINSKEEARTQIGEGVELVNGIIGYGCKIFYGCKAVRFVMLDNSALKYGARLIHSVLGENSTVSCCEILNNLIFPAHEQHHNTSFLIASLIRGQSNMAAGATIGSNHNSRAPDGEIEAGRGFWPGLCTSVKHSSRFASFCLLAKGDYRFELNISLPFCLVDNDFKDDRLLLSPAYWWTGNQYALMRNEAKFKSRDKRWDTSLRFEYSPFAPDTAQEIINALGLLEDWAGAALEAYRTSDPEASIKLAIPSKLTGKAAGKALLQGHRDPLPFDVLAQAVEHSSRACVVRKPCRAYKAYKDMLLWFAGREVLAYASSAGNTSSWEALSKALAPDSHNGIGMEWENLGGLLVSRARLEEILEKAEKGAYPTWKEFHGEYDNLSTIYSLDKLRYAWAVLGWLYPDQGEAAGAAAGPSKKSLLQALQDLAALSDFVAEQVYLSRAKDWSNAFRKATFRSDKEMFAVLGKPEENSFVKSTKKDMQSLKLTIQSMAEAL
jgi:NDP-sugar pyrophosphorylase family protein